MEQRPALHRGRRTSLHRVCAPACVEARPGESLTPQDAAALVVAHLPDNCGPV
ncbi:MULTISPECIES: DUF6193 family natural product biosynthesis protein [Streptomyces]|uniref:DUF6193 family natural product biosynthesis protein n=1 Tax=Streptomyces TaxID=1883 RepID=UPI0039F6CA67